MARVHKQQKKEAHAALIAMEKADAEKRAKKLEKFQRRDARKQHDDVKMSKEAKVQITRRALKAKNKRLARERRAPRKIESDDVQMKDSMKVKKLAISKKQ